MLSTNLFDSVSFNCSATCPFFIIQIFWCLQRRMGTELPLLVESHFLRYVHIVHIFIAVVNML